MKNEQKLYEKADRRKKGEMLTHLGEVTGLGRKTLITKLGGDLESKPRRKQRGRSYGPDVDDAIRVIWETLDYISAERITPHLASMARTLAQHGELECGRNSLALVLTTSSAITRSRAPDGVCT